MAITRWQNFFLWNSAKIFWQNLFKNLKYFQNIIWILRKTSHMLRKSHLKQHHLLSKWAFPWWAFPRSFFEHFLNVRTISIGNFLFLDIFWNFIGNYLWTKRYVCPEISDWKHDRTLHIPWVMLVGISVIAYRTLIVMHYI